MKNFFTIGEAAKYAGTTAETLRHYDRIGLVKPGKKDDRTGYRYYTGRDIVRLKTVLALGQMELSLSKIKEVLEYDDLEKIIEFLNEAERMADERISVILNSKKRIRSARESYESKLSDEKSSSKEIKVQYYPERVIMLHDSLKIPTVENLWNYLKNFYDILPESAREKFEFEDKAGIYTENGEPKLFAECLKYEKRGNLKVLPAGYYLCADCTEETKDAKTAELIRTAEKIYSFCPEFTLCHIVLSGILSWKYRAEVFIGENSQ